MAAVRRILTPFTLLDFDTRNCAARYGQIRRGLDLELAGKGIGGFDTLIAAHALAIGATLVTEYRSQFERVPALKLENWTE
jgi:tRNA(fMet)-specific endonuclease VapC